MNWSNEMVLSLIIVSLVIFLCVLLNKASGKLGIPMLLGFIVLGMIFGTDGLFKIDFENFELSEEVCSIALIFIIFYGGFGTKWQAAKPVLTQSILLSTIGVILTACFTGLFCWQILKFPVIESFLIGSVISSTDAASVFSILRSKRLNLSHNTASLLEIESGSNDPFSYMMTVVFLSILNGKASALQISYLLFAQIAFGLIAGVVFALVANFILKRMHLPAGFDGAFVISIALLSYAVPSAIGGNGYLAVYIAGIIIGNSQLDNKKTLVPFFDGVTGMMQMLIFFLLGLLSTPTKIIDIILPSLAIALFLTFVARPLAVTILMTPKKSPLKQQLLVSWTGLRGAASIVFAILSITGTNALQHDLFHLVFGIVLFSILFQGSLIPFVAKKLKMIDDTENVMRTFSDYPDEVPIQFISLSIPKEHAWTEKKVKDIILPPKTLIVLITRNNKRIIPRGNTEIQANDTIILGSCVQENETNLKNNEEIGLFEKYISQNHAWANKSIEELKNNDDFLIVLIKSKNKISIPTGKTIIKEDDVVVIEKTL